MDMQKAIEKIAEWMEAENVSQTQLAKKTGYSKSLISLILNFQRNPTVEFIGDVAEALGHSREEILRIANFLPFDKDPDPWAATTLHQLSQLPHPYRESVEIIIKAFREKESRDRDPGKKKKK